MHLSDFEPRKGELIKSNFVDEAIIYGNSYGLPRLLNNSISKADLKTGAKVDPGCSDADAMVKKSKPPSARAAAASRGVGSSSLSRGILLAAALAALLAVLAATRAQLLAAPAAATPPLASAGARLGAPSPEEPLVAESCEAIRPLWGQRLTPDQFLRDFWETTPLVAEPGAAWTDALFSLASATKVVLMWPFRIQKNHATAVRRRRVGLCTDALAEHAPHPPAPRLHRACTVPRPRSLLASCRSARTQLARQLPRH